MVTANYRREYYKAHRKAILESNRRCRDKRKHLWKKDARRGRIVRCADCGATVYRSAAKHYRNLTMHLGASFARCQECERLSQEGKDAEAVAILESGILERPYVGRRTLEENGLFHYSELIGSGLSRSPSALVELVEAMGIVESALSERESAILALRLLEGYSLDDIGREFHLTRERVRQIQIKAMRRVQDWERRRQVISVLKVTISNGLISEIAKPR